MELTPYVERLRSDLTDAAAAGGDDARATAERLMLALDPATRMVLLEALAQAASEISGELDHDAVDVRLNGREPEFVVTHLGAAEPAPPEAPAPPPAPAYDAEDDTQSRISLRLPESVKARAEERAAEVGQSLNAWLVAAVRDVLDGADTGRVDLRLGRAGVTFTGRSPADDGRRKHVRGWVE